MSVVDEFVGRSAELCRLDDVLDQARTAGGATLIITGPAGSGKTYLLRQVMARYGGHVPVLSVTCSASSTGPYGPWRSLLDQWRQRHSDPSPGSSAAHLAMPSSPREFADRLLALWATAPDPVVVLLDDAESLDDMSLQVWQHLQRTMHREALVVIAAVREGVASTRLGRQRHTMTLGGLSVEAVAELLHQHDPTATADVRERAATRLVTECQGHPLAICTRLRRIARHVAAGDVLQTLLAEPASDARSVHGWVRQAVDALPDDHRRVLASWVLAPTFTRSEFCESTGTPRALLEQAVHVAWQAGLVPSAWTSVGDVPLTVREVLVGFLPPRDRAATHLHLGRYLLQHQPTAVIDAAHHVERAAPVAPLGDPAGFDDLEGVVDILDRAGTQALAVSAFREADRLLGLADELAPGPDGRAQRLLRRSAARRGSGSPAEAHDLAHHAAQVARQTGDADLFAEAAVALTMPADWRVGDAGTQSLLQAALDACPAPGLQVKLTAALALQRFQIPRSSDDRHRWAWEFRPDDAAGLASQALADARRLDDDDALVAALLAWRSIHRQPDFLAERRDRSSEALSIAVRRGDAGAMVQAAVRVAVDELESANRDGFEHAAVVARWAADQVGAPLLLWRAHLLEATRAVLDADLDALQRAKADAVRAGRMADALGREATELALDHHVLALSDGWSVIATLMPDDDWPLVHHPLGVAGAAEAMARAGRTESAQRLLARLRWPADPHTSMLLVSTLAARAAVLSHDVSTAKKVYPTLVRFAGHVAVDPEAIWVEGPVALAAAEVADFLGEHGEARRLRSMAADVNRGLDCTRTAMALASERRMMSRRVVLPEREHAVLRLLADGLGNAQISQVLNFSVSTIRRETSSLYHRLGVNNRAAAVARAHDLGLL